MSSKDTQPATFSNSSKMKVAVLISGGGTTLKNLLEKCRQGHLPIDIRLVISSKASAPGLQFAREADIETLTISRKGCQSNEEFRDRYFDAIRQAKVSLVVMGGFLQHLLIPPDFANRVINVHPSLIPSFCGHGFYGLRVHQAAIDYGAKISGCTVHFVDDHYDHGPVLLQRSCPVLESDTAEALQQRVFELECEALPTAIRLIAENNVRWSADGRRVFVVIDPLSTRSHEVSA